MSKKGALYVISGPSGCGKGTILEEVLKNPQIYYSISATTRLPREGEVHGKNYFFISMDEFKNLINNDGVLEYAEYCSNYYGTPKKEVYQHLNEGKDVILEIEVQGAMKIKEKCPEAIFIFILPPSLKELRRRLEKRGTETEEVISKRLAEASKEISQAVNYDYLVVNNELEIAIDNINSILSSERLKKSRNNELIEEVLNNA